MPSQTFSKFELKENNPLFIYNSFALKKSIDIYSLLMVILHSFKNIFLINIKYIIKIN